MSQDHLQFEQEILAPKINGLKYIPDFITDKEEADLIQYVDSADWNTTLKRRVQHYGYKYDYASRRVEAQSYLGSLPQFLRIPLHRLVDKGHFKTLPDQCIVNEYLAGQGISDHIDCVPCFSGMIASLSLNSGAIMQFKSGREKHEIYLEPRSLILLSDDARYNWTHGIPARKSDFVQDVKTQRKRRISLTFRNVIIN